jgi:hypothetical protein
MLMQIRHRRHRGIAAVLAMLYLVLFSVLSLGFYASVTTATQIAGNEQRIDRARLAAESGMNFIRYHLWALNIDHNIPAEALFSTVYDQLAASLNPTSNFTGKPVTILGAETANPAIYIPGMQGGVPTYVNVNDASGQGLQFRLVITRGNDKDLSVTAVGRYGATELARGIVMQYTIFEKPSALFNYGVASKSNITMIGNTSIIGSPDPASGSVLSTSSVAFPLTMGNTCRISGDVSFSDPNAWVSAKGGSIINNEVGEPNWRDNIHHVAEPDFPVVDTSAFAPYATTTINTANPAGTSFTNIRIKAGTNPTFAGGTNIKGVVYIEAPNQVVFAGNCTITGVVVVQTTAPADWNPSTMGTYTTNSIDFRGTVNLTGVENLPTSDHQFDGLRDMKGAAVLAPNFGVKFGGTAGTGMTAIAGSIVSSALDFYGTADAVVNGSVINLDDSSVNFQGKAAVTIRTHGTAGKPAGLYFGTQYVPLPQTYEEIAL